MYRPSTIAHLSNPVTTRCVPLSAHTTRAPRAPAGLNTCPRIHVQTEYDSSLVESGDDEVRPAERPHDARAPRPRRAEQPAHSIHVQTEYDSSLVESGDDEVRPAERPHDARAPRPRRAEHLPTYTCTDRVR
ncbi:unnamed protein product [Arctia plantaginis]|uniref:Uncharacterized protein n=1 Tax=Arctia plantaginis TaxID=874455 RepID=A0A8S0Z219_ARCPL|nr:unnamed protein product [Arctia plantaginis]